MPFHDSFSNAESTPRHFHRLLVVACLAAAPAEASAQAPAGYYDPVDATDPAALRATLHEAIDDHQRYPYTAGSTDTWDILDAAQEDPNQPANILDAYKNASFPKAGAGNLFYNREHSWPKSYGFTIDGDDNLPYTDCHHLFLTDSGYNSARSNKPFRTCDPTCEEFPTDFNNEQGGGSGFYPGQSNWTSGFAADGTWEVWAGRRGDFARALLYLDVRYEGGVHGVTGVSEPDLILTDDPALIVADTTANRAVAYMGLLGVLLQWHADDPVDDLERARHEVVFVYQYNRNPFIDHPEWVDCLYLGACSGPILSPPKGLVASSTAGSIELDWQDSTYPQLAGYHVYRSITAGGPYGRLNLSVVTLSQYSDSQVFRGTTYYYAVTALDLGGPESEMSAEVQGTGRGNAAASLVWINEMHYDNFQTDTGEFVEVAGPADLKLDNWRLVGYNGFDGTVYRTVLLFGTIPHQQGCLGTLAFDFNDLQNGAPDGLALVDTAGTLVDFIAYEGTFVAASGPAAGLTPVAIGVAESDATPQGFALGLAGIGSWPADFAWRPPGAHTRALPNTGQVFMGCGCLADADCDDGLACNGAETCDPTLGCRPGTPVDCADGAACSVDSCDEEIDACVHAPDDGACDDGVWCNGTERCDSALGCRAGVGRCPELFCLEDEGRCAECLTDSDCADGLHCNGAETCGPSGDCLAGLAVDCADGAACTMDSCDEEIDACTHEPDDGACDDGVWCNGAERCDSTLGCQAGVDRCPELFCLEDERRCAECLTGSDCDDGLHCNGAETCNASGDCLAGLAVDCADGVACTVDSCDELADACEHTPDDGACDDGVWCNGAERCDSTLGCQAGVDRCPELFCLEAEQACVQCLSDDDCGPGLTCTTEGQCQEASEAGCGCQTRGGRQLAWPLLLAAALARIRRRRRCGPRATRRPGPHSQTCPKKKGLFAPPPHSYT